VTNSPSRPSRLAPLFDDEAESRRQNRHRWLSDLPSLQGADAPQAGPSVPLPEQQGVIHTPLPTSWREEAMPAAAAAAPAALPRPSGGTLPVQAPASTALAGSTAGQNPATTGQAPAPLGQPPATGAPDHDDEDDHDHDHDLDHEPGDHDDCQLREATLVDATSQISSQPLMDLSWTFQLHSSPSSSKVIYLDFNGHTTTGTSWNTSTMGSSFYSPAYDLDGNPASFNSEELSRIQQIWQRVAADFAPFDVNVTTQAPPTDWLLRSGSSDANFGMRAVITSYGPSSSTAGGIAKVGSFTASTDTPCFIYNKSLTGVAEAISHEVGHTLGLSHDGTSSSAYYYGHGSGETSWAPIMGVGYNKNVTQWDNGTYFGSNNKSSTANYGRGANDMTVITSYNGFAYQPDQVGNSFATASALTISGGQVGQFGRIETGQDVDVYSFLLGSTGSLNLRFDPYWYRAFVDRDGLWGGSSLEYTAPVSDGNGGTPYADSGTNLDLSVSLFSGSGSLLGSVDSPGLATTIAWSNLAAGSYYLRLDGVGTGSPTTNPPSGYSDVGSVDNYWISGTISGALDSSAQLISSSSSTTPATPTALLPATGSAALSGAAAPGRLPQPAPAPAPDALIGQARALSLATGLEGDPLVAPAPGSPGQGLASSLLPGSLVQGWQEQPQPPLAAFLPGVAPDPAGFAAVNQQPWGTPGSPLLPSQAWAVERPVWSAA